MIITILLLPLGHISFRAVISEKVKIQATACLCLASIGSCPLFLSLQRQDGMKTLDLRLVTWVRLTWPIALVPLGYIRVKAYRNKGPR
jgi:hypothetical protein